MPPSRPLVPDDMNAGVLAQLLGRLETMDARLQNVATRDDLSKLVPLALFEEARRSDTRSQDDVLRRLTSVEQDVKALRDNGHRREVAETREVATIQTATAQQIGETRTQAQQGLMTATRWTADTSNKVLYALVGFLSTGFVYLLIHALQHP